MKKTIFLATILIWYGCAPKQNQKILQKSYSVIGEGIAPSNTLSPTHAMVLAKKAAIADAYQQLAAKIYGIKISSKDSISNALITDSKIKTRVEACIKNAQITNNSYKDGLYRVSMSINIEQSQDKIDCSN